MKQTNALQDVPIRGEARGRRREAVGRRGRHGAVPEGRGARGADAAVGHGSAAAVCPFQKLIKLNVACLMIAIYHLFKLSNLIYQMYCFKVGLVSDIACSAPSLARLGVVCYMC